MHHGRLSLHNPFAGSVRILNRWQVFKTRNNCLAIRLIAEAHGKVNESIGLGGLRHEECRGRKRQKSDQVEEKVNPVASHHMAAPTLVQRGD